MRILPAMLLSLFSFSIASAATPISTQTDCSGFKVFVSNRGPLCPALGMFGQTHLMMGSNQQARLSWLPFGTDPNAEYVLDPAVVANLLANPFPGVNAGLSIFVSTPGIYVAGGLNAAGCTATGYTVVRNAATPIIEVSPESVCGTGPVTISIREGASFDGINWSVTEGSILRGQGTPVIEVLPDPSNTGQFGMMVRVQANESGVYCPASDERLVEGFLPVKIIAPGRACPGSVQTATLSAMNPDDDHLWQITNGTLLSEATDDSVQFTPSGSEDVILKATTSRTNPACVATDTVVIPVNPPSAAVDSTLLVCNGAQANIPVQLAGIPPFTITWSDGLTQAGIAGNTASRTVTPAESTLYSLSSVSDANCTGTVQGQAVVEVTSPPEIAAQPQNAAIRNGESVTLTVNATGPELRYYWYQLDGDRTKLVASGGSNSFKTPPLTATTSYWVFIDNSCASIRSRTAVVTVEKTRHRAVRR